MQFTYGSGALWGIPVSDADGSAITVPTPVKFGTLQNVSFDISYDEKQLHGQNQFPVDVARGKGKLTLKAAFAQISGTLFNSLFFGQTLSAGIQAVHDDTTGVDIPDTPYTLTVTPPSSGTWLEDLGVVSASGLSLTRVASSPATGQYSVTDGAYLFAAADKGATVYISYRYTATGASSKKITVLNKRMGAAPRFKAVLDTTYNGKKAELVFPACTASKLSMATKQDDYMIPEMDFSAYADPATNEVMYLDTTD